MESLRRQLQNCPRQHISVADGRYTHTRCVVGEDEGGPDERQVKLRRLMGGAPTINHPVWARRLLSSWNCHWRCEEDAMAEFDGSTREPTPFLSVLLACKIMYLKYRHIIYEELSVVFHRVETASDFLLVRGSPIVNEINSLSLSLNIRIEMDTPQGKGPRSLAR